MTASLPGQLVYHRGITPSPAGTSQTPPPALSGPGACHQFGGIRPQADQQGSVSRNADKHQPRDGLSDGLSDYRIPRCSR